MVSEAHGSENGDVHIQAKVAVLEAAMDRHQLEMDGIYARLATIERLLYIGLGGGLAIGGIASFFGWNILKMLGK